MRPFHFFNGVILKIRPNYVICAALLLFSTPAVSTTVVKMELEEIVKVSHLIVDGTVESVESRWDEPKRLIYTYVRVVIDDRLKGDTVRSVNIKLLGGTVGAINVDVPGMPHFRVGAWAILFLKRQQDNAMFDIVGLNQGRYEVTNEGFAVSNISGVDLLDPRTGQMTRPLFVQRFPLSEFKSRVRKLIEQQREK